MRKTVFTLAAIAGLSASAAFAGGMSEPVMEPEIVVEESTGSSGGIVLPLLLLALVAAIAADS
ncbi:hypothetical protein [Silicimonas sp. MF1-12-2]|jgi:hypothetical protein|uniref:hypothetical protein n=1 Tax=Silicimonas sp. MF1-12-2 TaxID=3384793 RepID=UPI0039B662FB